MKTSPLKPPAHAVWALCCSALLLSACAVKGPVGAERAAAPPSVASAPAAAPSPADPWENWNRRVFAFNDTVDQAVLQPVARVYAQALPSMVRSGIGHVFGLFSDTWSMVNNLLQAKPAAAAQDGFRVLSNVMFGLAVFDVATDLGLDRQGEDFGQTLGRWGVGPGPYVVWPLLGPSTLRDTVAMPVDRLAAPSAVVGDAQSATGVSVLQVVHTRASLLRASGLLEDAALDKYLFTRDAYLQRRASLVRDGAPEAESADE